MTTFSIGGLVIAVLGALALLLAFRGLRNATEDTSVGGNMGLAGPVSAFDKKGLANVVSSWVGSGKNQSIEASQLANVLGNDTLSQFASKAGIGISDAGPALAAVVPSLVDQLTPQGKAPEASSLESTLSGLLSSMR